MDGSGRNAADHWARGALPLASMMP
jgi:hypothetical protein